MTTVDHLARRACRFELSPGDGITQTLVNCVVDAVGCAFAGATHPRYQALLDLASFESPGVPLLGTVMQATPGFSCLANGFAIHAFDFDDDSYVGLFHPTATVLPALVAATTHAHVDGRSFLTALGAGIDAQCLASHSWSEEAYGRGWWNTALLGGLGAASATSRALGLGHEPTARALAAAAATAHGLKHVFGTDQKPLGAGLAARAGYEAAILARAGMTAPLDIFESPGGFLGPRGLTDSRLRSGEEIEAAVSPIRVPGISFKPWPVCNAGHAAIEATLTLCASHRLNAWDVEGVSVEVLPFVRHCLQHDRPRSVAQAQFSLPFGVASAILWQGPTLDALEPTALSHPDLVALMDRVQVVVSDAVDGLSSNLVDREGARVTVHLPGGKSVSMTIAVALGQTPRPLGSSEIDDKFLANVCRTLPLPQAEDLLGALRTIWDVSDVRSLFSGGAALHDSRTPPN